MEYLMCGLTLPQNNKLYIAALYYRQTFVDKKIKKKDLCYGPTNFNFAYIIHCLHFDFIHQLRLVVLQ